jgi:CRISPR-associated endonuclease/helicase Cas3
MAELDVAPELKPGDFQAFFNKLNSYDPFPWQKRLAERVCTAEWPRTLDLPTASGKTACLDIAVFAMAFHRQGPRRVFFVVDRRVVVDAAYERMRKIACKLRKAGDGILKVVADRLRMMNDGSEPLDSYQLRGGIYRDDSWVRSPLQPMLIASTVDQVGSRLLELWTFSGNAIGLQWAGSADGKRRQVIGFNGAGSDHSRRW